MPLFSRENVPHGPAPASRRVWTHVLPIGVLAAGILCVGWVVQREHNDAGRHDIQRFARMTDHVHARLLERLKQNRFLLESVRSTFLASTFVSEEEFETLVTSLDIDSKFPAITGIGFIRNNGSDPLEEGIRFGVDALQFDYFVSPRGDSPPSTNEAAEWTRTLEVAVQQHSDVISQARLINETPGFYWLDPVAMPVKTGLARIEGWVYAGVSLPVVNEQLTAHVRNEVDYELVELRTGAPVWTSANKPHDMLGDGSRRLTELRHVKLGGNSWVLTTWASPRFDHATSNANAVGIWGTLFSIALALMTYSLASSRRRAEQIAKAKTWQLAQNERQLRDIATRNELALEGGGLGLWDWNISSGTVVVDRRTCEIVGEDLGDGLRDLDWFKSRLHPDDIEQTFAKVGKHFADPDWHYRADFRLGSPEQGYRWVHASGRVVDRDAAGQPLRMVGTHADITERVEAEAASKRQSKRANSLARIITESPNELYIFGRDTLQFVEVNDGAVTASGYTRDELLGLTAVDIKPDFDEASLREKFQPLADGVVSVIDFQTIHERRDKSTYPVQISLHAAVYNDVPVYVAFVTDLTEIQRLESGLEQARRLESLGQLAAGIAHEINTPMQCVAGNIDYVTDSQQRVFGLVDDLLEALDSDERSWDERRRDTEQAVRKAKYERLKEQVPAALSDVSEASRRVVETVRAMKAMSHPGKPGKSSIDLNELINNATTITRNRWKYAAELQLDLDEDLSTLPGLQTELSQVLVNLIVNAADAIIEKNGDGGPLGKITVKTNRKEGCAVIEVSDTGVGIPESIRSKLFDPFFTTKEVGKGTGQGLAITYDIIVNKHDGLIDVFSTEGEGATFVVHLPLDTVSSGTAESVVASTGTGSPG